MPFNSFILIHLEAEKNQSMKRYEYTTVNIKLSGWGLFSSKKADGFEETLAKYGREGWRYVDTLSESGSYGEVGSIKLIFEREIE